MKRNMWMDIVFASTSVRWNRFSLIRFINFYFQKNCREKKKLFILVFFFLTSILLFINANMLSQKLSTLSNSSEILTILKENIAWSDYYQFFMKKMDYYEAFSIEELTDAVYKKQIPIPITLIKTMTSYSEAPFLFSPAIPAIPTFFSSVFKFDSVEIFFLLASIPYLVLYLFYIRIINTAFISKLKYLLYPIGLFLIKQEVDFLLPIVFLLVTLTSFGVYSFIVP
ncbi:MAG: hypothetical protein IPH52_17940 [Leptospiraceae bacterium]|nr:hypothetical protein [Leptospiraceae bacterium]